MNPRPSSTSKQSLRSASVRLKWVRLVDQFTTFSLTNNCFPWKYSHPTDPNHIVKVTSITSHMILLQPELIPNEYKEIHGITKGSRVVEANWLLVYSYLQPSYATRLSMKCSCRLLNDVEKRISFNPNSSPLKPIPLYMSFPHPNYATLQELATCLNELSVSADPDAAIPLPALLFIANGVYDLQGEYVNIDFPITIIGESREHCVVMGGICIGGKKNDKVHVTNLTVTGANGNGIQGCKGASMHLKNVCVENCFESGIFVYKTKRNTMTDCDVHHNRKTGVYVGRNGCMTLEGKATAIYCNVTSEKRNHHGLETYNSSSSIHLKLLTLESISTNNGGGGNYGGNGTIKTITEKYGQACEMGQVSIGMRVNARWKPNCAFRSGKIESINVDDIGIVTYDIGFDISKNEKSGCDRKNVPLKDMLYI